jgi:hypothetical protein
MSLMFAAIAGLLLGVGGDFFTVSSDIDALILPYRVLWLRNDWAWNWAGELQQDFRCCGFDATAPSPAGVSCYSWQPFCRTEIAAEFDRVVMKIAVGALVIGGINAVAAVVSAIAAIWTFFRRGAQVGGEPDPGQAGRATVAAAREGSPSDSAAPLCRKAVHTPDSGPKSPLCQELAAQAYQEAVDSPYHDVEVTPPECDACIP